MKIGIIGVGNIGATLARKLIAVGPRRARREFPWAGWRTRLRRSRSARRLWTHGEPSWMLTS